MNLSFATTFPARKKGLSGKETKFIEKIFQSLNYYNLTKFDDYSTFCDRCEQTIGSDFDFDYLEHTFSDDDKGKIHTIRKDESGRWQEGTPIHFLTEIAKDDHFQFAPVVRCTGKERIKIVYTSYLPKPIVQVNEFLLDTKQVKQLAENDGFDSVDDFFKWFDQDFEGWIIHWTPERYDINEIEVEHEIIEGEKINGESIDLIVKKDKTTINQIDKGIESLNKLSEGLSASEKLSFFGNEIEDEGEALIRMNNQKR